MPWDILGAFIGGGIVGHFIKFDNKYMAQNPYKPFEELKKEIVDTRKHDPLCQLYPEEYNGVSKLISGMATIIPRYPKDPVKDFIKEAGGENNENANEI
jgi:hypothetical protein